MSELKLHSVFASVGIFTAFASVGIKSHFKRISFRVSFLFFYFNESKIRYSQTIIHNLNEILTFPNFSLPNASCQASIDMLLTGFVWEARIDFCKNTWLRRFIQRILASFFGSFVGLVFYGFFLILFFEW